MNDDLPESSINTQRADWNPTRPEIIPRPTYWPASLAFSTALSLLGLVTSLIITAIGACLFAISIAGWIGEIRHERKTG